MTLDPLTRVTSSLQEAVADPGDTHRVPAQRDEAIVRLADALRRRRVTRLRRRAFGVVAAAAAVLALVGGAVAGRGVHGEGRALSEQARLDTPGDGLIALRDGRTEPLAAGARVGEGTELRTTESSEAHLDFDSGSRITIGKASRLRLVEQSQHKRFALEEGSFDAKVAKLGPNDRFVVATSDAEIEVRGTAFRVSIVAPNPACAQGSPTRLEVTEGVVVVRHDGIEERVPAGAHWPDCPPARETSPVTSSRRPAPSVARVPTTRPQPSAAPAPAPASSSHLAEQNDLFQDAMRRKRNGDARGALTALDRLRTSYAGGPLAENADVERFRVLAGVDHPAGVAAARDYLARWPNGFARADAATLASSPP